MNAQICKFRIFSRDSVNRNCHCYGVLLSDFPAISLCPLEWNPENFIIKLPFIHGTKEQMVEYHQKSQGTLPQWASVSIQNTLRRRASYEGNAAHIPLALILLDYLEKSKPVWLIIKQRHFTESDFPAHTSFKVKESAPKLVICFHVSEAPSPVPRDLVLSSLEESISARVCLEALPGMACRPGRDRCCVLLGQRNVIQGWVQRCFLVLIMFCVFFRSGLLKWSCCSKIPHLSFKSNFWLFPVEGVHQQPRQ